MIFIISSVRLRMYSINDEKKDTFFVKHFRKRRSELGLFRIKEVLFKIKGINWDAQVNSLPIGHGLAMNTV